MGLNVKHTKTYMLIVVPAIILAASFFLITSWMSGLTVTGMNHAPINEFEVQVYVNNNNPLTLTIYIKSLNDHHHIEFLKAEICDANNNTVADYQGKLVGGIYERTKIEPICELPPESEKAVRLYFNTTMSQGKYSLILYGYFGIFMPISCSDFIVYENIVRIYH